VVSVPRQSRLDADLNRRVVGRYQLLAHLGQGGMGNVYLAASIGRASIHRLYVVKELHPVLAASRDARQLFLNEARLTTRFGHPNVVQTYEILEEEDGYYLVMEYIEGQTLSTVLEVAGREFFSERMLVRVVMATLDGLHYAHELSDYDGTPLGVVHRDVSPHNVMLSYDGQVKLVDFGLAKATSFETASSGVFRGKVRYAAPEQLLCEPVDRRTDVFAAGIMLWEILAGTRFWQDKPEGAVAAALCNGVFPNLLATRPDVPPPLADACARALAFKKEDRFASARELRDVLGDWLESSETSRAELDLGAALSRAFARELADRRGTIDAQLRRLNASTEAPERESLPSLRRVRADELPNATEATVAQKPRVVQATPPSELATLAPPQEEPAPRRPSLPLPKPRSRTPVRVGLGVSALAAGLGVALMLRASVESSAPALTDAGAASNGASSARAPSRTSRLEAPSPAASVRVVLRASPDSTRFTLDGEPLPSNPFTGSFARSTRRPTLLAHAEGYESKQLDLDLNQDFTLELVLRPLQSAPPRTAAPAPALPRLPPPSPRRPRIEEDDPYSR
jgi:serine/threonine-protein kinase